jgi:hypothetical protein
MQYKDAYITFFLTIITGFFSQTGIRHANINCKSCGNNSRSGGAAGLSGIFGIRWNCSNCLDVDLCTPCYMAEKHDTSHLFWRIDRTNETSGKNIDDPYTLNPRFPTWGT